MGWLLLPTVTGAGVSGQVAGVGEQVAGVRIGERSVRAAVGGPVVGASADERFVGTVRGGQGAGPGGTELFRVTAMGGQVVEPAAPVSVRGPGASGGSGAVADGESSGVDLILPVAAAGAAIAVSAYSLVRRRRRAESRTTPTGTFEPPVAPLTDLRRRAERLLVGTDDSVRTSAEELRFAAAAWAGRAAREPYEENLAAPRSNKPTPNKPTPNKPAALHCHKPDAENRVAARSSEPDAEKPAAARSNEPDARKAAGVPSGRSREGAGALDPAMAYAETPAARDAVMPFVEALADADGELARAFRAGQLLDEEAGTLSPDEERALLEEILTRCTTAQRRLDTATPAFDQLRALERDINPALECAEARFRELTGRTATAATTLTALRDGYAPTACLPVAGHIEQAKDRLVFATTELNRARQAAYPGDLATAAVHLRAAEGAIDQADVFVTGVERLAAELARAVATADQGAPFTGSYDDPLDVLRRRGRWLLPAHSAVAAAADFVTTHRGAVGAKARTRLAEARRHLTRTTPPPKVIEAPGALVTKSGTATEADNGTKTGENTGIGTEHRENTGTGTGKEVGFGAETRRATSPGVGQAPDTLASGPMACDAVHAQRALVLAQEARSLAEEDVRAYENPYGGPVGDGLTGAVLGGIIIGEAPEGGEPGHPRGPACYGGTATRGRRAVDDHF